MPRLRPIVFMLVIGVALAVGITVGVAGCKKGTNSSAATSAPTPGTGASAGSAATMPAGNDPYGLLEWAYSPYVSKDDPVGFSMKVRNLSDNTYRFWRGSKELFCVWAKTNAADWMADQGAFIRIHGDLHPGNLGLYHSAGRFERRRVAFGAVDFDESAHLPFQIELLEGVITFQLLASQRSLKVTDERTDQIITAMLEAYRAALDSATTPSDLLEEDRMVGKMIKAARKKDYEDELEKYVVKGKDEFVESVKGGGGKVKEILHQEKGKGSFATAIEEALEKSPDGKDLFKKAEFEKKAIHEIVRRTQLESAGSEGLLKFLLLVTNKKVSDKRLILYVKQQIPSSAERVGLIPMDPRPAGQRSSEDMHLMNHPPAYFNSYCEWKGGSFRLSIKEPWTETMEGADVLSFEDLKHMARIWGTVAGSMHRQGDSAVAAIKGRLTPELAAQLRERANAYSRKAADDFRQFKADPRTRDAINKADDFLSKSK